MATESRSSESEVAIVCRVVPESPRWLLSQGRVSEAEQQLSYIAVVNTGRPPAAAVKLRPIVSHTLHERQAGVMDIVRHRSLRSRTLNNIYTWYRYAPPTCFICLITSFIHTCQ